MRLTCKAKPRFDSLERRVLFAVRTVDFNDYPINFTQFNYLLQDVHTPTTGFNYTIGTGDGQRPNVNGITWADSSYYENVLGSGGFNTVNSWNMKPVILYTDPKSGGWLTSGWNYVPDMAEGDVCIDDAGRAATTYATDYLLNGTESSYQTARDILTFVSYMTTRQGNTYNFAWLDPSTTYAYDPIYSQQAHFEYRVEYYKRTGYPTASPSDSWFDPNSTTSQIINYPNSVRANPFISQAKYSVYIDDLRDANNNDVATVYNGPLYSTASGGPTSYKTGIKKTWTNSTQQFGFDEARALMAVTTGLQMMQKREAQENGTLSADETAFTKFLENEFNRLYRNVAKQNAYGLDSKILSAILPALDDYYQLYYGTDQYGTFSFKLPANSNTAETTDDQPAAASVFNYIQNLSNALEAKQVRTSDWKNGIFADDGTGNTWQAYGQLPIYALARTYRMMVNVGQDPSSTAVSTLLDDAVYASDNFYGTEAYHYNVPGTNNVRTKERITQIVNGGAQYHNNSTQIAYQNSSIVASLRELAQAYAVSNHTDKATRVPAFLNDMKSVASWFIGNNTALLDMYDGGTALTGTYRGRGSVFDGINVSNSIPNVSRSTGGESLDEGLWAMILAKAAIRDNNISSTFSFEQGASSAAAPTVSSSSFDYNAAVQTARFTFSQEVGASIHAADFILVNTTTNQTVPSSSMAFAYVPGTRTLSITFPGYPRGVLPDGNYQLTVRSTGIVGNAGNPMTSDAQLSFFVLAGDANHDRVVDIVDLGILSSNWQQTGTTFAQGDFNDDGIVDIVDLGILSTNWQKSLPAQIVNAIQPPKKVISTGGMKTVASDVLKTAN